MGSLLRESPLLDGMQYGTADVRSTMSRASDCDFGRAGHLARVLYGTFPSWPTHSIPNASISLIEMLKETVSGNRHDS